MNTVAAPVYYPSPNVSRPASQLTEEEQVLRKDALTQIIDTAKIDQMYITEKTIYTKRPPHNSLSHMHDQTSDFLLSGENRAEDRTYPASAHRHL